jgi:hypothetical protein
MIITYLYDRSSIGLGLGVYVHDLEVHDPEYMDFYDLRGEEHHAWYDLHRSVHTMEQFDMLIEKYNMIKRSGCTLQPFLYQEIRSTLIRHKLDRILTH